MPLDYRSEVAKSYRWVGDGVRRLKDHPATLAAIQLAHEVLHYVPTREYSWQRSLAAYMERLRWAGVDELAVLTRCAEFYAFTADHPGRLPTTQAEDSTLGRLVLYLAPMKRGERRPSARVMRNLGALLREHCGLYSVRLVAKLRRDAQQAADLKAASGALE